ncbi:MAG: thioredoxin-like domain-containing protein, partial [Perlabentimonas sp.]
LVSLLLIMSTGLTACAQGYRIEAKFSDLKDTEVLLGYHFGEKKFIADTAQVNSKGVAVFEADSLLPGGMYIVILPERSYFDILVGDNQTFSFSTSASNMIEDLKFKGSPENTAFAKYQRFMNTKQKRMGELRKKMETTTANSKQEEEIQNEINALDEEVKDYWDKIIEENSGSLLANIINSFKPIEFPEFDIPDDATNPDSLRWVKSYKYNQQHYFDNIDLTDDRLTRTPFFQNRIDTYFDRVLLPAPDTISKYAVKLIEETRSNPDMFQFILSHLFSKYQNSSVMGMDAVFVELAEKYYLSGEAFWISDDIRKRIADRVADLKPNLIGEVAPNLELNNPNSKKQVLHNIDANVVVMYFWEPGCSHCKKVTPELKKIYDKYKNQGLKVYAIYTQADKQDWTDYIEKNNLEWINVWDPVRVSSYHKLYDIYSTPILYVLDKDKRIIAKRIGVESLERFIEQELKL